MSKKKKDKDEKRLKEVCCEKYLRKGKFCKTCPNRPENILHPERLQNAYDYLHPFKPGYE